jgi:antitoxin MazE
MKSSIQRWGNSLALRIPKSFAEEIAVGEGDEVEITVQKGRLLVAPRRPREYDLGDMVAEIHPENLHDEILTDRPQGREVW